ncbi:MAG: CotH kinase family protein, partial [Planctomycetales bacterium]|nr:CotH kinase family protein [Planctomycetales bacterium]
MKRNRGSNGRFPNIRFLGGRAKSRGKASAASPRRIERLEDRLALTVVISEFLASNSSGAVDQSGARHDWIELLNDGVDTVDVSGWSLSDDAALPLKYTLPATPATQSLEPGERLLVFASGLVAPSGDELHANFKLSAAGGDVVLTHADGQTMIDAYLGYPAQTTDVAYGRGVASSNVQSESLVDSATPVRFVAPQGEDAERDDHWREIGYDDSAWASGVGGVGFDRNSDGVDLSPFIDRAMSTSEMNSVSAQPQYSAYVRYAFDVDAPEQLTSFALSLRFDDGFIAYLNGKQIARANFAEDFVYTQPSWNSYAGLQLTSSTAGNVNRGAEAAEPVVFDLTPFLSQLAHGRNVLAFHGVNSRSSSSSNVNRLDFLVSPELTAVRAAEPRVGYLPAPTPGWDNGLAFAGIVADTKFSVDRGLFVAPFALTIDTATPDAEIRYTTDGSEPTESLGTLYTGPIDVTTTTVVRAVAYRSDYLSTNVDTQSYFFLADVIQQDASYVSQPYATWGHDKEDADNLSGYNLDDEADWEMDPDIVDGSEAEVVAALEAIPTLSVVMNWDDLFGGDPQPGTPDGGSNVAPVPQGIYIHGRSEERGASLEWINAETPVEQFQVDAAIEIQGHSSPTRWNSDKLSFQVSFKQPFGDSSLDAALFGPSPDGAAATQRFDGLILDAMYNYAWHHANPQQRDYARFVTDQVVADLQNAAGGGGPHGRYVHLYLNGLYWGLYNVHERPDESYAAEVYGGSKSDYYVVKHANQDIDHEFTWVSGGVAAEHDYLELLQASRAVEASPTSVAAYEDVSAMLAIDDFINYMIVHYYAGNGADWSHNNWYATRNANGGQWRFHAWDQEHAFPTADNGDSWTQFSNLTGKDDVETSTEIHQNLMNNAEYRLRFGDRVQQLLVGDGPLTPDAAAAAYATRLAEID